ncbi:hypothetical protein [Cellulomonas endophytica]|uniref:hypothetical protein n=1 Tax=Cellulomonas endophytica TaxID=2494735 RepID=UPI001011C061|nr:hypothetical protein [Cellulomonas endophytica]
MLVQEVVRGVAGLTTGDARRIMERDGLLCAALRTGRVTTADEAEVLLGAEALDQHVHEHHVVREGSPYVSTSAGTYVTDDRWHTRSAFAVDTAIDFAVLGPRADGWVFYGYVFLLGRPAGHHAEFAEEVRDVHQHPAWSPFRAEGEVAVPVRLPPRRLLRAELYRYAEVAAALAAGRWPAVPSAVIDNEAEGRCGSPGELAAARTAV